MKGSPVSEKGLSQLRRLEKERLFVLMFVLIITSWASIKIILPALPALPSALHTTSASIKLSVSLYLVFCACCQPFWGAIIQQQGCRRTWIVSMLVAAVGSMIAMLAPNFPTYLFGRVLEGIGMGAISPVTRTLLAGLFDREVLARRIMIITGSAALMPALAPIAGGHILVILGWRTIFALLLFLSVLFLVMGFTLLPKDKPKGEMPAARDLLDIYIKLARNRLFMSYGLSYAVMMGGLLGYYSATPYWYHVQFGIQEHRFSYFVIPTVGCYMMGILCARYMVRRVDLDRILLNGMLMSFIAVAVVLVCAILKIDGVMSIIVVMSVFAFPVGMVSPSANAIILSTFKDRAGPASALTAVIMFGASSITAAVAMNLYVHDSLWPLAAYVGLLALAGFAISRAHHNIIRTSLEKENIQRSFDN